MKLVRGINSFPRVHFIGMIRKRHEHHRNKFRLRSKHRSCSLKQAALKKENTWAGVMF